MTRVAMGFFALSLAYAGCGGASGGTTACTLGTGPTRTCLEIWANATAPGGLQQAAADCTDGGGVASTTCSRVGADGGCRLSLVSGSIMETTTQWFYAGMAPDEMAKCAMGKDSTWVTP